MIKHLIGFGLMILVFILGLVFLCILIRPGKGEENDTD